MKKKFTFTTDRQPITDHQLLQAITKLAAKLKRPVRIKDWDAWPKRPCSVALITARFGSWGNALRTAGLPKAGSWRYDPAHLMKKLEVAWRKLGRCPGSPALERITGITSTPYAWRWGSVRHACELLAAHKRGDITREQLLAPVPLPKRDVPARRRYQILKRDGYRCVLCGATAATGAQLHIDHIVPASKGGSIDPSNLRVLCDKCNLGKSAAA